MTTTPTSGAADLPEALRSIQRFEVVDCIDDKHVPAVIPKPHGPWVRYEDHIAALAAGQATAAQQPDGENLRKALQFYADSEHFIKSDDTAWDTVSDEPQNYWCDEAGTATVEDGHIARLALSGHLVRFEDDAAQPAAQQGVAYAALPTSNYAGRVYEEGFLIGACPLYTADQLRAFADATHALRASHGQAPATVQADSVLEDALSDAVRVPLDSLHADAAYLIGRLRDGSMPYARVIEIIRERIDAAKAAIRASAAYGQAPADAAPSAGAVAGPDDIDAVALARYKVVPAHESMIHRFAVVAGDGNQQLYLGREVECENMARKFAGAFLDGAFYQANITPPTQAADSVQEDAARESEYRRGYRHGYEQRDAEVRGAMA